MRIETVLLVATLAIAAPARAQIKVEDDPYRDYTSREIELPIGSADSSRHYCFTGGLLRLRAVTLRQGPREPGFVLVAILETLRTPADVSVDLLGGLELENEQHSSANVTCYNGCHHDAMVSYILPDKTMKAVRASGLHARVSGGGCKVEMEISAETVARLAGAPSPPAR